MQAACAIGSGSRAAYAALICFLAVVASSPSASGCSCSPAGPPLIALSGADVVFLGEVQSVEQAAEKQSRYVFEVDRVWKGTIRGRVEVLSADRSEFYGPEGGRPEGGGAED